MSDADDGLIYGTLIRTAERKLVIVPTSNHWKDEEDSDDDDSSVPRPFDRPGWVHGYLVNEFIETDGSVFRWIERSTLDWQYVRISSDVQPSSTNDTWWICTSDERWVPVNPPESESAGDDQTGWKLDWDEWIYVECPEEPEWCLGGSFECPSYHAAPMYHRMYWREGKYGDGRWEW